MNETVYDLKLADVPKLRPKDLRNHVSKTTYGMMRTADVRQDNRETKNFPIFWSIKESKFADLTISSS